MPSCNVYDTLANGVDPATMPPPTPKLAASFFSPVLAIRDRHLKIRWYMCVIVNLSSLNYADVIPQVYSHLDANLLSSLTHDGRFDAVQQIREGLTKSVGIVGAARTGNAMRTLASCTPEELMLKESPRSRESEEKAIKRGNEFFGRVYDRNPLFDVVDTERSSPDYLFVVKGTKSSSIFSHCENKCEANNFSIIRHHLWACLLVRRDTR